MGLMESISPGGKGTRSRCNTPGNSVIGSSHAANGDATLRCPFKVGWHMRPYELLDVFRSMEIAEVLARLGLAKSGSKRERTRRLLSEDSPPVNLLNSFSATALRRACQTLGLSTGRKADMVERLSGLLDSVEQRHGGDTGHLCLSCGGNLSGLAIFCPSCSSAVRNRVQSALPPKLRWSLRRIASWVSDFPPSNRRVALAAVAILAIVIGLTIVLLEVMKELQSIR